MLHPNAANRTAFLVVLTGSTLYLYEFFIRVMPSALTQELMQTLSLDALSFSVFTSLFYLSYSAMQIPAGLLADKFGPRCLLLVGISFCSLSLFTFALLDNFNVLAFSRLLSGLAGSFAYICPLMLANLWLPHRYFATATGSIQILGCMGGILGGAPVAIASNLIGWKTALLIAGVMGIVFFIAIYLFVEDAPDHIPIEEINHDLSIWQRLIKVTSYPQTWFIACLGFACWTPMAIFTENWGPASLQKLWDINNAQATTYMITVWVGAAIGGPFWGQVSEALQARKTPIILGYMLLILTTTLLITWHPSSEWAKQLMMFSLGFGCACQCVTFGLITDIHDDDVTGTAIGFNNTAVIAPGALLVPLVGALINMHHGGTGHVHPLSSYTSLDFSYGLLAIPVILIMALFITLFFIQETHCKRLEESHEKN
ncbi:MAG TPA: MFS transporter [Gammaproteobacteria bacterium]|nr:MFS transporter [Gammaproteobacteria bacterium]